MSKKEAKEIIRLGDVLKGRNPEEIILIHKYNVNGKFPYKIKDIKEDLLKSEVILINKCAGGLDYDYNAMYYVVK